MTTALRLCVLLETLTIVLLLGNLATVHHAGLASPVGPTHGSAYLAVIALVAAVPGSTKQARWLAAVPVLGGWLALRELRRGDGPAAPPIWT